MAEPNKSGFLSGYAGNPVQRFLRWGTDKALTGNQRAPDGTLDNSAVLKGLGAKAATIGLNLVAPGVGTLVGRGIGSYMDTGSFIPMGTGPMAYAFGKGQQQILGPALAGSQQSMQQQILANNPQLASLIGGVPSAQQVTRQQIGFPSNQAGQYAMARPAMNIPTMAPVQAQAPWTGSLRGSNPFGGAYGSNLGLGAPAARGYGRAAGSFTPNGAGVVQVAGNGWAGSDAAAGFGLGAQGAGASSAGGIALADAIAANKRMRD